MGAQQLIVTGAQPRAALREALSGYFRVLEGLPEPTERVYYDTFDGRLFHAGLTVFAERGELVLCARDREPLREPLPGQAPSPLHVDSLLPGPLRELLTPVVGVRVLLELARVRLSTSRDAVLDQLEKTVVRLRLDRPEGLCARVSVEPLRGYRREGSQVTEVLLDSPMIELATIPLVDEAVLAAGGQPGGVGPGTDVEFDPGEPADIVVAQILLRLTQVRAANLHGLLEDLDIEFLHDYRVALRRSRAVVRELAGVFPSDEARWLRTELRWLQLATGETRDLDVYVHEFEQLRELTPSSMRGDLEPLREVLLERHRLAREAMIRALLGPRAADLQDRLVELTETLPQLPADDRPLAQRPIGQPAAAAILRLHRRMIRMGRAIDRASPPEDYHELRKQGKELRYMLELFGRQLTDRETSRSLIRALKGLQDVLGRHQDREVQIQTLRALADQVADRPGGAAALMAMGGMIEALEEQAASARAEFHRRFARFASAEQRRLVKNTFGGR